MSRSIQQLVELQQRQLVDNPRARRALQQCLRVRPYRPVSPEELAAAEAALGFPLPALLRVVYACERAAGA